jgi:hypothetical protein
LTPYVYGFLPPYKGMAATVIGKKYRPDICWQLCLIFGTVFNRVLYTNKIAHIYYCFRQVWRGQEVSTLCDDDIYLVYTVYYSMIGIY